jgi:hypothetical protein
MLGNTMGYLSENEKAHRVTAFVIVLHKDTLHTGISALGGPIKKEHKNTTKVQKLSKPHTAPQKKIPRSNL